MRTFRTYSLRTLLALTAVVAATVTVGYWASKLVNTFRLEYKVSMQDVFLPSGEAVEWLGFTFNEEKLFFVTVLTGSDDYKIPSETPRLAEEYSSEIWFPPNHDEVVVLVGTSEAHSFRQTVPFDTSRLRQFHPMRQERREASEKEVATELLLAMASSLGRGQ